MVIAAAAGLASCSGEEEEEEESPVAESPLTPLPPPPAAWEDGIALAIVYDTSGSMHERIPGEQGVGTTPKYVVASAALVSVVDRIEAWQKAAPKDAPRRVEAALVTFGPSGVPMGPFDAEKFRRWAADFNSCIGPTPLGTAILAAGEETVKSNLLSKHVIVITDGQNTEGPAPEAGMDSLESRAKGRSCGVSLHFVAFDVDAAVFSAVKSKGATVVGASDAKQLGERLKSILEEEILLESAAPAKSVAR